MTQSYIAATSTEKAKALRLEAVGKVRIVRELDICRGARLLVQDVFIVEPIAAPTEHDVTFSKEKEESK